MTAPRDPGHLIRAFLMEGPTDLSDPVFDAVRASIEQTRQRAVIGPWRTPIMNRIVQIGLAAVAVVVVVVVAYQYVGNANTGAQPTPTPEPTPAALASGSFRANLGSWGQEFQIEATGTGDDIAGTMEVSALEGTWSADLQCSRTADNGLLVIAGRVTGSTNETFAEGAYVAILFAPGTPVRALLWLDDEASPADSCTAFLDTVFTAPEFLQTNIEDLPAITGDLELGS